MWLWMGDVWARYPNWVRWPVAITLAGLALSALESSGEPRFIEATIETFLAYVIRYGVIVLAAGAGFLAGQFVHRKTGKTGVAVIAGIVVGMAIGMTGYDIGGAIPGVGDRLTAMQNDNCHVDWDGHSNPVVCD